MYCSKCGKQVHDDDIFCSRCGSRLNRSDDDRFGSEEVIFNNFGSTQESESRNDIKAPREAQAKVQEQAESPNLAEGLHDQKPRASRGEEVAKSTYKIDSSEFVWDVHDFTLPEKKKPEEVVVDWKKLDLYELETEELHQSIEPTREANQEPETALKENLQGSIDHKNEENPYQGPVFKTEEAQAEARPTRRLAPIPPEIASEIVAIEESRQGKGKRDTIELGLLMPSHGEESFRTVPEIEKTRVFTLEDIEQDLKNESAEIGKDAAKINKFYTFNQKNEEFQKLLDREYERVNRNRNSEVSELDESIVEDQKEDWDNLGVFDPVAHLRQAEEKRKQETDPVTEVQWYTEVQSAKTEDTQDSESQAEASFGLGEMDIESNMGTKSVAKVQGDIGLEASLNTQGSEARIGDLDMPDILDNDTIYKRFDTKELEKDLLEIEIQKEIARRAALGEKAQPQTSEIQGQAQEQLEPMEQAVQEIHSQSAVSVPQQAQAQSPEQAEAQQSAQPQTSEIQGQAQAPTVASGPISVEHQPEPQIQPPAVLVPQPEPPAQSQAVPQPQAQAEPEAPVQNPEPEPFDLSFFDDMERPSAYGDDEKAYGGDYDDYDEEDAEPKRSSAKNKFLIFIIVLATILLVAEATVLGVRHFAPDSQAAEYIDTILTEIVRVIENLSF